MPQSVQTIGNNHTNPSLREMMVFCRCEKALDAIRRALWRAYDQTGTDSSMRALSPLDTNHSNTRKIETSLII